MFHEIPKKSLGLSNWHIFFFNSKLDTEQPRYNIFYKIPTINSLWTSDAISRYKNESTLVQAITCCLTVPSHYLNQCWLIISKVQWPSSEGNSTRDLSKISFKSRRCQWVKSRNDAFFDDFHRWSVFFKTSHLSALRNMMLCWTVL